MLLFPRIPNPIDTFISSVKRIRLHVAVSLQCRPKEEDNRSFYMRRRHILSISDPVTDVGMIFALSFKPVAEICTHRNWGGCCLLGRMSHLGLWNCRDGGYLWHSFPKTMADWTQSCSGSWCTRFYGNRHAVGQIPPVT